MKQIKVLRHERGEIFLQETVNDWLLEQHLTGKDIDLRNIHVSSSSIIVIYDENDPQKIEEIRTSYKERREKDNYFRSK
jgi:hypothetical protein